MQNNQAPALADQFSHLTPIWSDIQARGLRVQVSASTDTEHPFSVEQLTEAIRERLAQAFPVAQEADPATPPTLTLTLDEIAEHDGRKAYLLMLQLTALLWHFSPANEQSAPIVAVVWQCPEVAIASSKDASMISETTEELLEQLMRDLKLEA